MKARLSRELSVHGSAMKLQQIRGVRQAECWMSRYVSLAGIGQNERLASKIFTGQLECPLAGGLDGWLDDMMEAGLYSDCMDDERAGQLSWPGSSHVSGSGAGYVWPV